MFALPRGCEQGADIADACVAHPRPEMHELVAACCRIPKTNSLIMAGCDESAAVIGPEEGGDGAAVRDVVVVQDWAGAGAGAGDGVCADDADAVVEIEGGEGRGGAADVEDQDAAVGVA